MKWLLSCFCRKWLSVTCLLGLLLFFDYHPFSGIAVADVLTVTTAGIGSGSVNSTPAGISCVSGSSANCSASFATLSAITLTATPDWKSLDGVFSLGCSGTGSCSFNINGDTGVTVTFNPNLQAALIITHPDLEPKFSSLSDAYGYAVANGKSNFNLAAQENTFSEDMILSQPISFTLAGGKNSGYYTNVGFTTLDGYLDIQAGSIVIDSLIIQ